MSEKEIEDQQYDVATIKVHLNDKQFDFSVPSCSDDWDDDIYSNLRATISDEFDMNDFRIYVIVDGDDCFIEDNDELIDDYAELDDDDEMHIYVKVRLHIT